MALPRLKKKKASNMLTTKMFALYKVKSVILEVETINTQYVLDLAYRNEIVQFSSNQTLTTLVSSLN
jgi:hypothetical protein